MTQIIIWWSSGDFYRITDARNTQEQIAQYFTIEWTNALEIMFRDQKTERECSQDFISQSFVYCSIHLPGHEYKNDLETHTLLKRIEAICTQIPIKNIIIHPDMVIDWSVFESYKHLPFSVENMDERKVAFQWVADIKNILDTYPFLWFTLDLQHCFVNDPTMQLAKDFHEAFGDRLVEYHISWYHPELLHYPLFKTQQNEIIQAVENRDIPIIIESTFDQKDELAKEIAYIQNFITS